MAGSPVFSNFMHQSQKKKSKGKFLLFAPNSYLSHDRDISILSRNYPTLSKGNIMLFDFNWNCAKYLKTTFLFCNQSVSVVTDREF